METFDEYLKSKKIDGKAFKLGDVGRWKEFEFLFGQMHPKSLTSQKLFLINEIRRKYPLKVEEVVKDVKKVASRPVMKPKPAASIPKKALDSSIEIPKESKPKIKPKVVVKPRVIVKPKIKPPKED